MHSLKVSTTINLSATIFFLGSYNIVINRFHCKWRNKQEDSAPMRQICRRVGDSKTSKSHSGQWRREGEWYPGNNVSPLFTISGFACVSGTRGIIFFHPLIAFDIKKREKVIFCYHSQWRLEMKQTGLNEP